MQETRSWLGETCLTWVRCDKSGKVNVSENTSVLDRSVFRDAGDVILVRRDVFLVRRDVC